MARSKLSVHAIPIHNPDALVDYVSKIKPPLVLIVNPDANFVSRCFVASPDSFFSLRNHPLSEQLGDVYADPAGTGDRHAREMVEYSDKIYNDAARRNPPLPMPPLDHIILPGVNEPLVGSDEQVKAVVEYNIHYLEGLRQRNRRGSGLEFSVGWPKNDGSQGAPPQWEPWRPVYEVIKAGRHFPSIHEYWPKEGPSMFAGWLAYRMVTWIPSYWHDVEWIFTEVGLDDAAFPGRAHNFWQDFYASTPETYVSQFAEYERNIHTIKNREGVQMQVKALCIFTSDFGGREWRTADITPIQQLFVNYVNTTTIPDPSNNHIFLPDIDNQEKAPQPPSNQQPSTPVFVESPPATAEGIMQWTISSECRVFGIDPVLARAIIAVESGGLPFVGGRPVIRNEVHILHDNMDNKALWEQHFQTDPVRRWEKQMWRRNPSDAWQAIHTDQKREYEVFEFAKTLDSHAAHLALGMGAAQIMGFNYRIPEYPSPEKMFEAFSDVIWGPANQVLAMFAYFWKNNMVPLFKAHDLAGIAAAYNGSGQVALYVSLFKKKIDELMGD